MHRELHARAHQEETGVKEISPQIRKAGFGIRSRLIVAFSVFVAMLVCMAGIGAWRLHQLDETTRELATINLRMERLAGDWLSLTRANAVRATVLTRSEDEDLRRMLSPEMEATTKRITEIQKEVEHMLADENARSLFRDIGEKRKAYLAARQSVLEKRKAGQPSEAAALMEGTMIPAVRIYVESIKALAEHFGVVVGRNALAAHESAVSGRNVLAAFCAAGVALALMFCWFIMRSITRPVSQALEAAQRVAGGDLTIDIASVSRDEMGLLLKALQQMTGGLRDLVSEVANGARTVAETSAQIAQGNVDLSQRTEEQASTLEETASSMEELTSTVAQNADSARQASELAVGASEVAQKGGRAVAQVVTTMTAISDSSKKISDIISVIDGIAFQTNILALNAAVEAARAGEQGRGFAVVAAEVRNLAQRSAQAAKEIKALIGHSVAQVEAGTRHVDQAGQTMGDIVTAVGKVSRLVAEIAAASREQSSGIEQVNTAITQMDQVLQQNASLVEEAAAATESMKAEAGALLNVVSRFRLPGQERATSDTSQQGARPRSPTVPTAAASSSPPQLARSAWAGSSP
jgi:methyl-accepting chemotaxis protein